MWEKDQINYLGHLFPNLIHFIIEKWVLASNIFWWVAWILAWASFKMYLLARLFQFLWRPNSTNSRTWIWKLYLTLHMVHCFLVSSMLANLMDFRALESFWFHEVRLLFWMVFVQLKINTILLSSWNKLPWSDLALVVSIWVCIYGQR